MSAASVLFTVEKEVAVITLNRPDKLNSFNRGMALALQSCLDDCADKSIRSIYITGAGKGFSAGQDLAEVTEPDGPGMAKILGEHYNPIITRLRNLPKPVIAAVNGVAAGAGVNIALACDIVVTTASASFIQAFSKIGLIPDSGGTYFLPRLIGHQKATALMMLGDKVSAEEAERLGMIYKVYADEVFVEESLKLAHQLAKMATLGLAYTKLALNASADNTLEKQLALEDELQQKAAASNDFAEGVQAFLEKRTAIFKGN